MKLDLFKNFFKSGAFQPVLTLVLIALMIVLAIQLLGNNNSKNNTTDEVREISRRVSFEEAANNYFNGTYNVLTNGSLYVRDFSNTSITGTPQLTSTPSVTDIPIVENKFDNIFFIMDKGSLKRVDAKSYGLNSSLFFNRKGEIVFMDNSNKQYTLYKVPADTEKDAVTLFSSTDLAFKQRLFPLSTLLSDYNDKKYNPVERAYNVYSGKWTNASFTDGKTVDVTIQTDPVSGVISAMSIASTNPPSVIYFEFRKLDSVSNYDDIPSDFKSLPVPADYKAKE